MNRYEITFMGRVLIEAKSEEAAIGQFISESTGDYLLDAITARVVRLYQVRQTEESK